MSPRMLFALLAPIVASSALAATTVRLPDWACGIGDTVFGSGFEAAEQFPSSPSNGSGGAYPGNVTRTIAVPGIGNRTFYLHLPPGYAPGHATPLLIALHGETGSAGTAPAAAQRVRADWSALADGHGFIVLAPVASGLHGGWQPDTDLPALLAQLADTKSRYDIEQSRIDLWGYSAGAHVAHAFALDNTDLFAAYGVSAGSLTQFACTDNGSIPRCSALLSGTQPKIPVDIHLGNQDPLYTMYGAGNDPSRFENGGWVAGQDLFYTLFNGGHIYTVAQLGEIWTNICPFALGP